MDLGVKGKTYVLVGGSRGMGFEAARVLAQDGANVALIGRNGDFAKQQAEGLAAEHGVKSIGLSADASRPTEVEEAIRQSIAQLGPVAGLLVTPGSTNRNGTLLDMTDEDWEANFQEVLMSTVRSCRAVLPHLLEQGGGTLVTTAAYSTRAAKSFLFAYAALKNAMVNFTKNLAKTYGPQGIRANCVCPGAIETDVLAETRRRVAKEQGLPLDEALEHVMLNEWKMDVALKRIGKPHEVGELMAFLLSDRAAYMTGAIINIDGGTDF